MVPLCSGHIKTKPDFNQRAFCKKNPTRSKFSGNCTKALYEPFAKLQFEAKSDDFVIGFGLQSEFCKRLLQERF